MRILLDENLPRLLAGALPGHEVRTVQRMHWSGRKDGDLLRLAAREFDTLITMDRSLEHQQVLPAGFSVIVLMLPDNKPETVLPVAPNILAVLQEIQPGTVIHIRPH